MARRAKSTRQGRSGDPRKRAAAERTQAAATPELEDEVAAALDSGHPLDIAMLASSLIAGIDQEPVEPGTATLPPPAEFVRMFLESDDERLQILAWTVSQLLPDAALQTSVDAVLEPGTVPSWLAPLSRPEVAAAWQATDPLRDSTDVVVSVRIGGEDLTVVGLIDFNTGGALKDGFAIPAPLAAVQAAFAASGETGLTGVDLSPAEARGWLLDAIAAGRGVEPPFSSDSWPQAQPLLEWVARQCPPGGRGWVHRAWTVAEIDEIVGEFARTPEGGVITDPADRAVLVEALHLLAEQSYGDPLLVSAVKLELGLGYLWPTALHHDLDQLLGLPDLLPPYVSWAHGRRGIPADDTDEALAMIAHRRAEFVRDVAAAFAPDEHDS